VDIQQPRTSSGCSLQLKHISQQVIVEFINSSDSEECTEIPDSESFSEHFYFSGSSNSSEEEISPQSESSQGHKRTLREKLKQ
jgi:hypothetical protein